MRNIIKSEDIRIETERIDEIPLLYRLLEQMEVAATIDKVLPKPHGNHQGLSYGELAASFVVFMLNNRDHRISYVEDWAASHFKILGQFFPEVTTKDFTDDRLEDLFRLLGDREAERWRDIDKIMGQHLIAAYHLPTGVGRIDTTSGSVYHQGGPEEDKRYSLFQYGYSKDRRADLMQFIELLGTIDPLGMPIIAETLPGNTADATVYLSSWRRMAEVVGHKDFILVGDCKLTSIENQAKIDREQGFYLGPLAWVGALSDNLPEWIKDQEAKEYRVSSQKEDEEPVQYFELPCQQSWEDPETGEVHSFESRYLVVRSPGFATIEEKSLDRRLEKTERRLEKLSSQVGKRKLKTQEAILQKTGKILSGMEGFFWVKVAEETQEQLRYEGPGRPGPNRKKKVKEQRLFHLEFGQNKEAIAAEQALAGYRVYATNAPQERLSVPEALEIYRDEWTIENNFRRLKGPLLSMVPLYLRDETCVTGLLMLMTIALKLLTLMEFVVRRNLKAEGITLEGLYISNPRKKTERPTAERLLELFGEITLSTISLKGQKHSHVSPLNPLQEQVLSLLGLSPDIYKITEAPNYKLSTI